MPKYVGGPCGPGLCPIRGCVVNIRIPGKTDVFDRAVGTFAGLCAYHAGHDCEMFVEAIKSGEITADYEKPI